MKRLDLKIFQQIWLGLFLLIFQSCVKEDVNKDHKAQNGNIYETRILIHNNVEETDEQINSLKLFVFKTDGDRKRVAYLERTGLAAYKSISLPLQLTEGVYDFYIIANDEKLNGKSYFYDGKNRNEYTGILADIEDNRNIRMDNFGYYSFTSNVTDIVPMGKKVSNVLISKEEENDKGWIEVEIPLRRLVNKMNISFSKEGEGKVSVEKVTLKRRPDSFAVFKDNGDAGSYLDHRNSPSDEKEIFLQTSTDITTDNQLVSSNYIFPNLKGNDGGNSLNKNYAYHLEIQYKTSEQGEVKTKTDILPPFTGNNQKMNINGRIKSKVGKLDLEVTVNPWNKENIADSDYINFKGYMGVVPADHIISDGGYQVRQNHPSAPSTVSFDFSMKKPEGYRWKVGITDPTNFEITGVKEGLAGSQLVTFKIKPKTNGKRTTEVYILVQKRGETEWDEVMINPLLEMPGTLTRVKINQYWN